MPFYEAEPCTGFPSPAKEFEEKSLDLNTYIIQNPIATFFVRVGDNEMTGAGIFSGDILVIDRSLTPRQHHVVLAVVDGMFLVKRLKRYKSKLYLIAENSQYPPILLTETQHLIWGVVTYVIHSVY